MRDHPPNAFGVMALFLTAALFQDNVCSQTLEGSAATSKGTIDRAAINEDDQPGDFASEAALAQTSRNSRPGGWLLTMSLGGTRPGGALRRLPNSTPGMYFGIGSGYRWHTAPRLQMEGGLDGLIWGLGVNRPDAAPGEEGYVLEDTTSMLYLGPRVFLTPRDKIWRFSVGGGGALGWYRETEDDRCRTCRSRRTQGWYGLVQMDFYNSERLSFGFGVKQYLLRSNGELFDKQLGANSRDRWTIFYVTGGWRF